MPERDGHEAIRPYERMHNIRKNDHVRLAILVLDVEQVFSVNRDDCIHYASVSDSQTNSQAFMVMQTLILYYCQLNNYF